MGKKRKVILIFFCLLLLSLFTLFGFIAFYAHHPSKIKPLIEAAISRSTGARCTIETLSHSFRPLNVQLTGLSLRPAGDSDDFHLQVPELKAEMSLEGPFARKRLIVKKLTVQRPTLLIRKEARFSRIQVERAPSSFLSRLLQRLIALFLFRDVLFQAALLDDGHVKAHFGQLGFEITQIRAELNSEHRVEISCRGELDWPSRQIHLAAGTIQAMTDHAISLANLDIRGVLKTQDAFFRSPEALVEEAALDAKLHYNHARKTLSFEPLEAHLQGLRLNVPSVKAEQPMTLRLNASGDCQLQELKLSAHHVELIIEDLFHIKGELLADFEKQGRVQVRNLGGYLIPQRFVPFFPEPINAVAAPFKLSGDMGLRGDLEGFREMERWVWRCNLQSTLKGNRFVYETAEIQANSTITGEVGMNGTFPNLEMSLSVAADETSLAYRDITVKPSEARLSLTGQHPLFRINALAFRVPDVKFKMGGREILVEDIHLQGSKGTLDLEKGNLLLPEMALSSSSLQNLLVSMDLAHNQLSLVLKGEKIGLIESAQTHGLFPEGWKASGLDALRLYVALENKRDWAVNSEIRLKELSFENRDGTAVGEGITFLAAVNGKGRLDDPHTPASIRLEMSEGEILYDRFYVNLNTHPFASAGSGDYDRLKKNVHIRDFALKLKNILALDLNATVGLGTGGRPFHLFIGVPEASVEPIFQHLVFEPFRRQKPLLEKLKLGGAISARLELEGLASQWEVKGQVSWRNGELRGADDAVSLHEINLDLPLWYQNQGLKGRAKIPLAKQKLGPPSGHTALTPEELHGNLSVGSVTLPLLPEQKLAVPLLAGANVLSVPVPTILSVPGGDVEVGPVTCSTLFPSPPSIVTSLTVDNMDLASILSQIWPRAVQGSAQVKLAPIRLEKNTVHAEGKIRASAFGGRVILSDLSASGIFTSAAVFRADVRIEDLHLADLTQKTSFGRIEGILEGEIEDLEIAYGQPQAFDLRLETVNRKGVPQKISVRAVDNIAQIGGGHSPFIGFAGVFASLFKEFPYEKIGVRASLRNDMFKINGTVKEGGKEYLVKRGSFSGVNVVNQNPDNLISFKDMVKRIQRVTSSKSGPVVK